MEATKTFNIRYKFQVWFHNGPGNIIDKYEDALAEAQNGPDGMVGIVVQVMVCEPILPGVSNADHG